MPPINLNDIFPQLLCESAANAHVGKNETLDLKQAGTDFCIMHPYERHGNMRLHIFFMPNIIHINGRLINGCISRVGRIKWVYSVPTGTQTDALRCSNRNKWTHWYNEQEKYSTLALSIGMLFDKIQKFTSLRISDHLDKNVRLILNKICKMRKILVKHVKGRYTRSSTHLFMPFFLTILCFCDFCLM